MYGGHSFIYGDRKLLAELQKRVPDSFPFLREQVPNYFFAPLLLSREALGLPPRTSEIGRNGRVRPMQPRLLDNGGWRGARLLAPRAAYGQRE